MVISPLRLSKKKEPLQAPIIAYKSGHVLHGAAIQDAILLAGKRLLERCYLVWYLGQPKQ